MRAVTADFGKFWAGQAISTLGSAFTGFALPLLVYGLTRSAVGLAVASVASYLPWPLFGLVVGAWVDRVDRKRVMIVTDLLRAAAIASIPALEFAHRLTIWWIYAVAFVTATLSVVFTLAQVAAVPSLVSRDDLVRANGRIQASFSAAGIVGPALAGVLVSLVALPALLTFDALSFLISAGSIVLVKTSFNSAQRKPPVSIRRDVVDGLSYVWRQPVVRNIVALAAIANLLIPTIRAQLVLFADQQFHTNATQLGWLYAAGPVGALLFSLITGRVSARFKFSRTVLGSSMLYGLAVVLLAVLAWYWAALVLLAASAGFVTLFNITQSSLRQRMVPNELLGRVTSAVNGLAQLSAPVGAMFGGLLIAKTNNAALIYGTIGGAMLLVSVGFAFTALGHAEQYLPRA